MSRAFDQFLKNNPTHSANFNKQRKRNEFDEEEEDEDALPIQTINVEKQESDLSDGEDIDTQDEVVSNKKPKRIRDGEQNGWARMKEQGIALHDEPHIGKKRAYSDLTSAQDDTEGFEKFGMDDERPERETRDRWLESLEQQASHQSIARAQTHDDDEKASDSISYDSLETHTLCEKLAECLQDAETVQAAMKRLAPVQYRNRNKRSRRRGNASEEAVSEPTIDEETRQQNKAQLSLITDLTSALIHRGYPHVFSLNKRGLLTHQNGASTSSTSAYDG